MNCVLSPGQIIKGCWEQKVYKVIKLLGRGGTGQVYLVENSAGDRRALKMSTGLIEITHEHRILAFLNQKRSSGRLKVIPRVYELDDFRFGSTVYHYFVTEYCHGKNLAGCLGKLSARETTLIGLHIAEFLAELHDSGLVFGDLKPGNVLFDFKTGEVRIVDYGSVSVQGQGLKQYTPGYDRATWQAGSRVADEGFDIFSLGMLMANMVLGKISRGKRKTLNSLVARVYDRVKFLPLRNAIIRALNQETLDCREIVRDLSSALTEVEPATGNDNDAVVNLVGVASVISFFLGLFYYLH